LEDNSVVIVRQSQWHFGVYGSAIQQWQLKNDKCQMENDK
jgi:hypothetical protein